MLLYIFFFISLYWTLLFSEQYWSSKCIIHNYIVGDLVNLAYQDCFKNSNIRTDSKSPRVTPLEAKCNIFNNSWSRNIEKTTSFWALPITPHYGIKTNTTSLYSTPDKIDCQSLLDNNTPSCIETYDYFLLPFWS